MVGTLGKVRAIPKPGSEVVKEALNLLSALGSGNLDTGKLLEEMRETQEANESVYEQAKQATTEASKREQAASEAEQALADSQRQAHEADTERARQVAIDESRLNDTRTRLEADGKAAAASLAKREAAVEAAEADIKARRSKLEAEEAHVSAARAKLDAELAAATLQRQTYERRIERLRAAMDD